MFVNNPPNAAMTIITCQRTATILAISVLLSACSVLKEDKIDYKAAVKAPSLEIPPDLTQLRRDSRYVLESSSVTATGFRQAHTRVIDAGTAANTLGKVMLQRQGDQRWLLVAMPADQVWASLRDFWKDNGFPLTTDSPELGIMETDWAENRAKLPQDFIRKALGRVLDPLYSTGERDRYRTRIERNTKGEVEIYISHRGLIENYATVQKDRTVWQPRPSEPELEIEFLRRLMLKLGSSPEDAQIAAASLKGQTVSIPVDLVNGQPTLSINEGMDRAWRRVGVALDRSGFTVEDRDMAAGRYFVRYVAAQTAKAESGFLTRLFGGKKEQSMVAKYGISLVNGPPGQVLVRVLNANGQPEQSKDADKILRLIAAELR
jgi:outer membrane protein assembly factor BamC